MQRPASGELNNDSNSRDGVGLLIRCPNPTSCPVCDQNFFPLLLAEMAAVETLFDPVSLKCGHMFCYSCACAAAAVTIIEGLERANRTSKCPLCRQESVFREAVRLVELNILLSKRCEEYWEQRLKRERLERLQQAKKHWEDQCRAFMGL